MGEERRIYLLPPQYLQALYPGAAVLELGQQIAGNIGFQVFWTRFCAGAWHFLMDV